MLKSSGIGAYSLIEIPYYQTLGSLSDPYFSDVELLLHGDGENGSKTITDSSSRNRIVTANGNAQISTAQSKFTSSSIYFDGTGDYLSTPVDSGLNFGASSLTWEAWVYPQRSAPTLPVVILGNARADAGGDYGCFLCYMNNEFRFRSWLGSDGAYFPMTVNLNQWYHVAGIKIGGLARIWVNGIEGTSGSLSSVINYSHTSFLVGTAYNNGGYAIDFEGYMNEIRLTRAARENNSIPTAPFPNN